MHYLLNLVLFCRTSSSFGQLSAAPFVNGDMQHFLPVGREWAWNCLSIEIIAGLLIQNKNGGLVALLVTRVRGP